jgi:hypothetical protein
MAFRGAAQIAASATRPPLDCLENRLGLATAPPKTWREAGPFQTRYVRIEQAQLPLTTSPRRPLRAELAVILQDRLQAVGLDAGAA